MRSKLKNGLVEPLKKNTIVIDLLLGDTLVSDTCHEIECKGAYHTYVWPIHRYANLLQAIKDQYPNAEIEIHAFPFHCSHNIWRRTSPLYRSIDYGNKFKEFCCQYFSTAKVHVRGTHSPDEDFIYASELKVFVPRPHSGYACLVGKLVYLNEGRVLRVQDFWDPKLDPDSEAASSFLMFSKSWLESAWNIVYGNLFLSVSVVCFSRMRCTVLRKPLKYHRTSHDNLETVQLVKK